LTIGCMQEDGPPGRFRLWTPNGHTRFSAVTYTTVRVVGARAGPLPASGRNFLSVPPTKSAANRGGPSTDMPAAHSIVNEGVALKAKAGWGSALRVAA
jgi:hypothetical protein